jgi:hypothetical protein
LVDDAPSALALAPPFRADMSRALMAGARNFCPKEKVPGVQCHFVNTFAKKKQLSKMLAIWTQNTPIFILIMIVTLLF